MLKINDPLFSTVGNEGGSKEIPYHRHENLPSPTAEGLAIKWAYVGEAGDTPVAIASPNYTIRTSYAGNAISTNNCMPFKVAYKYRRTS